MTFKLLSPQDLVQITGKKRSSAQATWFKQNFGVDPVRRADGTVVMTAETIESLMRKRMGIPMQGPHDSPRERPPVYPRFGKRAHSD